MKTIGSDSFATSCFKDEKRISEKINGKKKRNEEELRKVREV